jgi:phage terminase large subunit-like protein
LDLVSDGREDLRLDDAGAAEVVPAERVEGRQFDKGWNGARNILSFACGSSLSFKTYQQDPSTLGGAELKFVGYDEPPPQGHREESRMRLMGGGFEMFAMTPLKSNTGYVRRVIWKQRESPDITVVKGSIHDNPTLGSEDDRSGARGHERLVASGP